MNGISSMHLHFERNTNAKCDCTILSLSWMGKVPDELPEDEGWKLNRTNYYQEGWLATGNVRGIVGVTFTTSHCKKAVDFPTRTNYNLRGHRSDVMLVKWNEPYQKLASCDSSGIIFVWIKYEGRWSIELINDRNTPVTHFSWSHDGRMALICYQDGFVLVGSVAGQRYWSSMLNLESTITCGIWTPDDQQVYFGTTAGQIIVMDVHGAMVSQVQLSSEVGITMMAWSCEKFKMEEGDDPEPFVGVGKLPQQYTPPPPDDRIFILAVSLQNGYIFLMKNFDDVSPIQVHTGLCGPLCLEWSNSRELLAVAGTMQQSASMHSSALDGGKPAIEYTNVLKFYSDSGVLLYSTLIPYTQSPVTALTWGHNDKRLFVATGPQVHIAWVSRRVASLQLMCRLRIHSQLSRESQVAVLPLPPRIKALISNLFAQTIRCCVPDSSALRDFVSRPPVGSVRLHCTMIRHDDDSNANGGTCYTLYLEYLGGLVPLLKGKRTSKIRPEFVIFDPQLDELALTVESGESGKSSGSSQNAASDTSDTEREEGCGSPRVQRRKRRRNKSHNGCSDRGFDGDHDETGYMNNLPDHVRLVEVTSNIWGTKFKIHGLGSCVPANLGQVTYKTSLLHLQPRQMTLVMTELRDDFPPGPDPTFNPNLFSEDEEEAFQHEELGHLKPDSAPPIAPMTPRPVPGGSRFQSCLKPQMPPPPLPPPAPPYDCHTKSMESTSSSCINGNLVPMLAKAESYEDEFPYVDLHDVVQYCDSLRATLSPSNTPSASKNCSSAQISNSPTCNNGGIPYISRNIATTPSTTGTTITQTSRHISPLVCEGVVPNLQSPKNAVAPSEVLERNPSSQTLMAAATSSDHSNNVQRMKSVLAEQHSQNRNGLNLNLNMGTVDQNAIDLRPLVMKRIDSDVNYNRIHHLCGKAINNENKTNSDTVGPNKQNNMSSPVKPTSNGSAIVATKSKEKYDTSPISSQEFSKSSAGKPDDLQYIDEENIVIDSLVQSSVKRTPTTIPIAPCPPVYVADSMVRSCSVGYLDLVDAQMIPSDMSLFMLHKEVPKRLVLVNKKNARQKRQRNRNHHQAQQNCSVGQSTSRPLQLKHCGKSRSLDSSDIFPSMDSVIPLPPTEEKGSQTKEGSEESINEVTLDSASNSPLEKNERMSSTLVITSTSSVSNSTQTSIGLPVTQCSNINTGGVQYNNTDNLVMLASMKLNCKELLEESQSSLSCQSSPRLPRSSPASPAPSKKSGKRNQSSSPIRRHLLNSPLLSRRQRKSKAATESSDDEVVHSGDEVFNGKNYHNLESFQKAQLRQKLKRVKCKGDCSPTPPSPHRREFVMHNKAPMWNENSQVYQLDFGGRVTQESAKNFQIEFRGKQVMQFGRIDGNAYTLDFQYPFSALQAFAVALANVTQRLK